MKNKYFRAPSVPDVSIEDAFWSPRLKLIRDVMVPYQWRALHDEIPGVEKSGAVQNMRIAAGDAQGEFQGWVFQDSDLYKWMEAASYLLAAQPDAQLEAQVEEIIDLMARAQQPDGYLDTYFIIKEPDRKWKDLSECHELYCAGHMMEAAVAHYEATGKRSLLDIACKFADCIDATFGPDKIKGYPGHEEVELALVKLYHATGERRYLDLAAFFINERGQQPLYFEQEWARGEDHFPGFRHNDKGYAQAHLPVREQQAATGHAVRATYLYSGMVDVARETADESLMAACHTLWNNVTGKQMYITGGIGSSGNQEAFTRDYDLPNDTAYTETCASIALIFFARRMLSMTGDAQYADVMERALYNGVLSGVALDGQAFFYVNPLETSPAVDAVRHDHDHVKTRRQGWYGCACCPPNLARLLSSLGEYVYAYDEGNVLVNLFVGSAFRVQALSGVTIRQETQYPWNGRVKLTVEEANGKAFTLRVRIPAWCQRALVRVNGASLDLEQNMEQGYAVISRVWFSGDVVEVDLPMQPTRIYAHPSVREDAGKVALMRGPIVYCLEEDDNGPDLQNLILPRKAFLETLPMQEGLLEGVVQLRAKGLRECPASEALYSVEPPEAEEQLLTFVPYYAWGNRTPDREMRVWVREN